MNLTIHTDGGARGNPGEAAVGVVIKQTTNNNQQTTTKFGKKIGTATNNEAEYQAVIHALEKVSGIRDRVSGIDIYLDSLLVCNQLKGLYKVKKGHLQELLLKIRSLEQEIGVAPAYIHIPREKNKEADRLVNQALDTERRILNQ